MTFKNQLPRLRMTPKFNSLHSESGPPPTTAAGRPGSSINPGKRSRLFLMWHLRNSVWLYSCPSRTAVYICRALNFRLIVSDRESNGGLKPTPINPDFAFVSWANYCPAFVPSALIVLALQWYLALYTFFEIGPDIPTTTGPRHRHPRRSSQFDTYIRERVPAISQHSKPGASRRDDSCGARTTPTPSNTSANARCYVP